MKIPKMPPGRSKHSPSLYAESSIAAMALGGCSFSSKFTLTLNGTTDARKKIKKIAK